jgi:hypothetical protein
MAIPSRQIGWSTKSNLLWEISKQLEALTGVIGRNIPVTTTSTTSTTTTAVPSYSYFANYSTTSGPAACYQAQDQFTIYTPSPIGGNTPVFTNDTLVTPAPDGWYSFNGIIYQVIGGVTINSIYACPATDAYSYVISQIDLNASIGNTDTNLNGKIITSTTDDGSGSPSSRTFSSAGGYNHWMCSLASIVPTFGYWANDVFIDTGLISTQTNIGPC